LLDPHRAWAYLMRNEKPGGHGERSVAVGTIDMALWDARAKIEEKPLFRLLAGRHGRQADPRVFVYAAGGYYYPGKDLAALRAEMRSYLDRGYNVVKMKIGGASIAEDRTRIEACCRRSPATAASRSTPTGASISRPPSHTRRCCGTTTCSGTKKPAIR
jgi:L-alanine-DL-glutamate epimerase-like enolase superfamily enzyme